jgi:hypothetical protein
MVSLRIHEIGSCQIGCNLPEPEGTMVGIRSDSLSQDFPVRHSPTCREAIESRKSRMAPRRNV